MGHETARWGGRGLGYMLFNAHLCNQPYYWEVVVGPGAQLCTLLEVWVLRVGMSTLGRKRLCTSRIGDPQVPMTMEHPQYGFAASGLILRKRFQIGMFRPIRLDHTNCLQVAIKTHSFIETAPTGEARVETRTTVPNSHSIFQQRDHSHTELSFRLYTSTGYEP